jgi:DNA-binding transcriptional LysR family regulator
VASGLGWSIVPDFAYRDAAIAGLSLVMLPQTTVLGICYGKAPLSDQERRFIDLARSFFAERAKLEAGEPPLSA